jgi:TRAP-type C4-dicarboxylate transport system substrate-binding protein
VISEKWFQRLPPEYQQAVIESAREAVQVSHGIAALAAIKGWEASCKNFKKCHILTAAEKKNMAEIARPAWKQWVTTDFGIDARLVDTLWAEVARLEKTTSQHDMQLYGR